MSDPAIRDQASQADISPGTTTHPVVFSGDARTYFGIWIVNLLLSILTLGIYSAWAKVRTEKYFHQHTSIDGRRFDYHATGKQILIGRIIVVIGFIVLSMLGAIPVIGLIILFGLIFLVPWLMVRALRFRYAVTSWSGVRFRHEGRYGGAFKSFLLYPFLSVFTLYLAMPLAIRSQYRFRVNQLFFGKSPFRLNVTAWDFYKPVLMAGLWVVVAGGVIALLLSATGVFSEAFPGLDQMEGDGSREEMILLAVYAIFLVALLPAGFIYQAFIRNAVYEGIVIDEQHHMRSTVKPMTLVWVALSNALATILSLGLLLPWAKVRMARYLSENTTLIAAGSLDAFVAHEIESGGAIGDAYGDIEGLDLGVAI